MLDLAKAKDESGSLSVMMIVDVLMIRTKVFRQGALMVVLM